MNKSERRAYLTFKLIFAKQAVGEITVTEVNKPDWKNYRVSDEGGNFVEVAELPDGTQKVRNHNYKRPPGIPVGGTWDPSNQQPVGYHR